MPGPSYHFSRLLLIIPIMLLAGLFENEMVGMIFAFTLATVSSFMFPAVEKSDTPPDTPPDTDKDKSE